VERETYQRLVLARAVCQEERSSPADLAASLVEILLAVMPLRLVAHDISQSVALFDTKYPLYYYSSFTPADYHKDLDSKKHIIGGYIYKCRYAIITSV
jgi:hypothetical protein